MFVGLENSRARFFGVYRVGNRCRAFKNPLPDGFPYPEFNGPGNCFYELESVHGFEDLKGRVVIDWGNNPLAWHQWLTNASLFKKPRDKEVVEVLPAGYVREFPGYLDFVLSFDELTAIVGNPAAHREWHRMLAVVAGVYLIVDNRTGKQYVGSASGEGGILSRWSAYAAAGHGGNKQLADLIADDANYARDFSFTLLHPLPRSMTRAEVISYETLYKKKLGSRAFGLNSN